MAIPTITKRKVWLSLDARWTAKWKWLWDDFAGPNETYTGYIDAWDSIPWQRVLFDDGIERDFNFAAQAQYIPKYAGEILGTVEDLANILEGDGILYDEILAQYSPESPAGLVNLKRILYKDFDTTAPVCSAVYSRPVTHTFGGIGHIGDNSKIEFYIRPEDCCDGTSTGSGVLPAEFLADAIHFARIVKPDEIPEVPERARLVVYAIAAGSCPRLKINDTWFPISPIYMPPYGDPYGFIWKGYKHIVGNIADLGLTFEESNTIIVEHIAPRPDTIGCQVFFAFEWDEPLPEEDEMEEKKPGRGRAHGDYIARWQLILDNLEPLLQEFPYLQDEFDALTVTLEDAIETNARQEKAKADLAVDTEHIQGLYKDGDTVHGKIMRHLKGEWGPSSPKLKAFLSATEGEIDKTKEGYGEEEEPVKP